jgi:hypothetical protein
MYRPRVVTSAPFCISVNAVHVLSGTAVSPVRTLRVSVVLVGTAPVQLKVPQSARPPASWIRERKLPLWAYGVNRIQSTATAVPPALMSLTAGSIAPVTVALAVATTVPSIENTTLSASQSIR